MKKSMLFLGLVTLLGLASSVQAADPSVSFTVIVVDQNKNPIPNATVTVRADTLNAYSSGGTKPVGSFKCDPTTGMTDANGQLVVKFTPGSVADPANTGALYQAYVFFDADSNGVKGSVQQKVTYYNTAPNPTIDTSTETGTIKLMVPATPSAPMSPPPGMPMKP